MIIYDTSYTRTFVQIEAKEKNVEGGGRGGWQQPGRAQCRIKAQSTSKGGWSTLMLPRWWKRFWVQQAQSCMAHYPSVLQYGENVGHVTCG